MTAPNYCWASRAEVVTKIGRRSIGRQRPEKAWTQHLLSIADFRAAAGAAATADSSSPPPLSSSRTPAGLLVLERACTRRANRDSSTPGIACAAVLGDRTAPPRHSWRRLRLAVPSVLFRLGGSVLLSARPPPTVARTERGRGDPPMYDVYIFSKTKQPACKSSVPSRSHFQ